jgi:hypothetical protein
MTDNLKLKVVPIKPGRGVPKDAVPCKEAVSRLLTEAMEESGVSRPMQQRLEFIERLVFGFRKDLDRLQTALDLTEVRLNKSIRLGKVLAEKAGIPD